MHKVKILRQIFKVVFLKMLILWIHQYVMWLMTSFFHENGQDCNIVTISHKLIAEVNCTEYLITIRFKSKNKKLHKSATANTSVCDAGNKLVFSNSVAHTHTHAHKSMLIWILEVHILICIDLDLNFHIQSPNDPC